MNIKRAKRMFVTIGKLFLWSGGMILIPNISIFLLINIPKTLPREDTNIILRYVLNEINPLYMFIILVLLLLLLAFLDNIRSLQQTIISDINFIYQIRKRLLWIQIVSITFFIILVTFVIWGLIKLFKTYITYVFLLNNNLLFSFLVVLLLQQFTVRKRVFRNLSWKKLSDVWLKFPRVPTISIGGLCILGLVPEFKNRFVKIALDPDFVNLKMMISIYIFAIIILFFAQMVARIGRSISSDENTYEPIKWFQLAFGLAWFGNLFIGTLFLDCLFLTLQAHLSA